MTNKEYFTKEEVLELLANIIADYEYWKYKDFTFEGALDYLVRATAEDTANDN